MKHVCAFFCVSLLLLKTPSNVIQSGDASVYGGACGVWVSGSAGVLAGVTV